MNAPVTASIIDARDVLAIKAATRAFLWWEYQFETLADAVDPLQAWAETNGLVDAIGQDAVQALIAEPFLRIRTFEERQTAQSLDDELDEYDRLEIARRIERWEEADHLLPKPAATKKPIYRTPQSTIDAFWYTANTEPGTLTDWLLDHPLDAPFLRKLAEARCTSQ
jgi:hypothetical protein